MDFLKRLADGNTRIGLAFELVEPDELKSAALNLASQLAEKAPDAYRGIKSALRTSIEHADAPRLQEEVSQFIEHWFSPAAARRPVATAT